ncbi:MAG: hypothetical protein QNK37_25630 [Acidobacteriota bacterium]|nr:hypothetical protein [Acidobacteriota bacterium]
MLFWLFLSCLIASEPTANDELTKIFVIELQVTRDLRNLYPEFETNKVGFGLCSRVVESIYETGRFQFLEEKDEVFKRILAIYVRRMTLEQSKQIMANYETPDYLFYAEVFDFWVTEKSQVQASGVKKTVTVEIGIQLRMTEVATGAYIPASATGTVQAQNTTAWGDTESPFSQTLVGRASRQAIEKAVEQLIQRWDKKEAKP